MLQWTVYISMPIRGVGVFRTFLRVLNTMSVTACGRALGRPYGVTEPVSVGLHQAQSSIKTSEVIESRSLHLGTESKSHQCHAARTDPHWCMSRHDHCARY
jgi:hypothetical protein